MWRQSEADADEWLRGFRGGLGWRVASVCCRDLTLQTVVGTVAADNYTYYTLSYNGPVSLVLESM